MNAQPKKYISDGNGNVRLNPAYTAWKNGGAVAMPTTIPAAIPVDNDTVPVAMASPIAATPAVAAPVVAAAAVAAPPVDRRTLLQQGRSKRVLLSQASSKNLSADEVRTLKDQGYTNGLIKSIARSNMQFPLRIWVVDNSGSMMMGDGHRLVQSQSSNIVRYVNCSRWAEIKETVEYHARLAALLENPTVFRLLNDPGRMAGDQQFSIAERGSKFVQEDLDIAMGTMMMTSPSGVTPLTEHIREIRANVEMMKNDLSMTGQKVVVVLATDGLPSDNSGYSNQRTLNEFKAALRSLQGMPVWIVVRLCTDEERVVNFYNELDSQLELSIEVLDDFVGEAEEVYEHNKWLNYGLPLHRIREMGFSHKLFDLLDERKFTLEEVRQFCYLLFGPIDGLPDPQIDLNGFIKKISRVCAEEKQQWNPVKKRMMPWIDVRKLSIAYSKNECSIM